jgi:hypothetical protein
MIIEFLFALFSRNIVVNCVDRRDTPVADVLHVNIVEKLDMLDTNVPKNLLIRGQRAKPLFSRHFLLISEMHSFTLFRIWDSLFERKRLDIELLIGLLHPLMTKLFSDCVT